MSTVVRRLHEAIMSTPGPQALSRGLVISLGDAVALDRLIAALCDAETVCGYCNSRLCEDCGVGDRADTDGCGRVHCADCAHECRTCLDSMGDDAGLVGL